jgi:hypothetical protein
MNMIKFKRKHALPVGLGFILSFVLFYLGVYLISYLTPFLPVLIIQALVIGVISGSFVFFNLSIGLIIFTLGYITGFGLLYYNLLGGFAEWNGLILLTFSWIIGLVIAIVVEIVLLIIKKVKKA